jgi:hypothetical protein
LAGTVGAAVVCAGGVTAVAVAAADGRVVATAVVLVLGVLAHAAINMTAMQRVDVIARPISEIIKSRGGRVADG